MKVLIATPCYGGLLSDSFVLSMVETQAGFRQDGIDYSLMTLGNESLINRARNKIGNFVMNTPGFDKLIFIDADIGWRYADLRRLLVSDKKIVGGTYPMKTLPIALNFNVLAEHRDDFKHRKSPKALADFKAKYGNEAGEVEVEHIPTGFMLIDVSVFHALKEKVNYYVSHDLSDNTTKKICEFFPVSVQNHVLESEDWGFCRLARESGYKVYLNANIITKHIGNFCFDVVALEKLLDMMIKERMQEM